MPPIRSIRPARPPASSTPTSWACSARRATSRSAATRSSACSTCWSRKARSAGRRYTPDPPPETGSFFRSDHFTFAKVGVPAMSFTPGEDLVNGGVARGAGMAGRIYRQDVPPAGRRISPDWDFTGMAQDAELLHAVGLRLANSCEWPNWSQDSEFRAARDASSERASQPGAAPAPLQAGQARRARMSETLEPALPDRARPQGRAADAPAVRQGADGRYRGKLHRRACSPRC